MLKNISLTLVVFLLIGCTNTPEKTTFLSPKEPQLISEINQWKINDAQSTFSQIKSSLDTQSKTKYQSAIDEKINEINDLNHTVEMLKIALSKNQFFIVERYTDMSIKNRIRLNELKKLDLSNTTIISGKPVFKGNEAHVLTIINFYDESYYLDIIFNLKNGQWKVINFNERR